ncbi:fumarylacetoacetate hydrolase family protein [Rhizobium calliandrae]|uniref:Fumarylacetoacetate hydrolase family protein n=1 Tax=Rhizobium calliandrae TaxID=1312182 RepID=A0ABT7KSM1_9HYPH|nr:fumarylacetoacetate hydrolase family protein [Rhizobium calliandrae]MDL2410528.1 fumarylacetoacetate hydrolase family protein [Rhizobium calliandrae]
MNTLSRLFPSPEFPSVTVRGESRAFPVHRIFCVGRNYAEHAKEMGFAVDREAPFYFLKSALAAVPSGATLPYPPGTSNYHYEMELVVAIGTPAFQVAPEHAMQAVYGYAAGLDMTRRDLQIAAREKGRPWDLGKDFEQSAVIAEITRAIDFGVVGPQRMKLSVAGSVRQDAHLSDLIWSVPEIISHLSGYYHLAPGDLIFTGTPAGVGPVVPRDMLHGEIDGLAPVNLTVGEAKS